MVRVAYYLIALITRRRDIPKIDPLSWFSLSSGPCTERECADGGRWDYDVMVVDARGVKHETARLKYVESLLALAPLFARNKQRVVSQHVTLWRLSHGYLRLLCDWSKHTKEHIPSVSGRDAIHSAPISLQRSHYGYISNVYSTHNQSSGI